MKGCWIELSPVNMQALWSTTAKMCLNHDLSTNKTEKPLVISLLTKTLFPTQPLSDTRKKGGFRVQSSKAQRASQQGSLQVERFPESWREERGNTAIERTLTFLIFLPRIGPPCLQQTHVLKKEEEVYFHNFQTWIP